MIYPKDCDNCSCIKALELLSESCPQLKDMQTNVTAARTKCTDQEETGSFGYCRVQGERWLTIA